MAIFKIHGFTVYQRENGIYYIKYTRTRKNSLQTKDLKIAKKRAQIAVEKYFQRKVVSIQKEKVILITEYLEDYILNRGDLSEKTHKMDKTSVMSFVNIIGDKPMHELSDEDIAKFKRIHQSKKTSKTSINSYLRHIKAFLNQAKREKILSKVPIIKKLKLGKRLPRILTKEEREQILQYAFKNDIELYRIIQFDLYTGCRRSEIISAKWENYNEPILRVIGKGDKERSVPILLQAKAAMGTQQESGTIFIQLHPDTYTHRFQKITQACGVKNFPFKNLRHSAATAMIESGISLEVIQKILGHQSITTTQIYADVLDSHMIAEIQKLEFK